MSCCSAAQQRLALAVSSCLTSCLVLGKLTGGTRRLPRPALLGVAVGLIVLSAGRFPARVAAGEPIRLTTDGKIKMDPVFVDGGKAIVYAVQDQVNQFTLMKLSLEDRTAAPVHPGAGTSEFGPAFSADGRRFACIVNDGNLHVKIVIEDLDAGSKAEFNPGGGFAGVLGLSMHPDGGRVVFAFPEQSGNQQIFSLRHDGSDRQTLTLASGIDAYPRYSSDGREITFASTRDGDFDIYTMNADGTALARVAERAGLDTRPTWSPGRRRLAYVSLRDGNYDVYVVNRDGTGEQRVTAHPERDDFPCFAPDGKRLLIVGERDGAQDLYLVDIPAGDDSMDVIP